MFGLKHSPSGYKVDECISSVQKAVRRGDANVACFFGKQLIDAGFGQYLLKTLMATVACEDIGLGCVKAPGFLVKQFKKWKKLVKAAKLPVGKSSQCPQAVRLALDTVSRITLCPSSRMAATASGASFDYQTPPVAICEHPAGEKKLQQLLVCFNDAFDEKENSEKQVLFLANVIFSASILKIKNADIWLERAWGILMKRMERIPKVLAIIKCLHEMTTSGELNASNRLCFFESCLLIKRYKDANWGDVPGSWDQLDEFLTSHATPPVRAMSVPDYALEKHTQRGKGISTLTRLEQVGNLFPNLKVSEWSKEEIAKSHGTGRTLEENVTQISRFFDVGAVVGNEWMKDPYFEPCRKWYLQNEEQFGYRQAKTKFMTERQDWMNKFLMDTFGFEKNELRRIQDKKKKKKRKKQESSKSSEPDKKKKSKTESSVVKKRVTKKRKDGVNGGNGVEVKPKKQRKSKAEQMRSKAKKLQEEKEVSSGIEKLKMETLTRKEITKIRTAPLGQYVAGLAKKGIYQMEKYAWKGPYNVGKHGQALRVFHMARRVPLLTSLGVRTPEMDLYRADDDRNEVWLRFPQLASKPENEWKVEERTVENRGVFSIVNRDSMGIIQAHRLDTSIWEENPEVLGEMICALAGRYLTEVVTGDSHLVNLLYAGGHIHCIDIEEKRFTYPDHPLTDSSKDEDGDEKMAKDTELQSVEWSKYLFAMKPKKKAFQAMERGIVKHRGKLGGMLKEFDAKCRQHLSGSEQRNRWKYCYHALEKQMNQ